MKERMRSAALRRKQLVAQCHLQRAQLAAQLQPLGGALESADAGARIVRRLGQYPEWIAAAAAGLVLLTPRRLSAALRAGAQAVRLLRRQFRGLPGRQ